MARPDSPNNTPEEERGAPAPRPGARARLLARAGPLAFPILFACAIAALFLAAVIASTLSGGDSTTDGPKSAVIIDQLGLTAPNPQFVESARTTMEQAGYKVDYFPGKLVTVDFYRELPTRSYDLILMRVHSARYKEGPNKATFGDDAALYTSEPFSVSRYVEEQGAGRIGLTRYRDRPEVYFGVMSGFVRSEMKGDFGGATVIMMGCDGLRYQRTGEAFIDRGAGEFVSWTREVTAGHTDRATERLLEFMLIDGLDTLEAVSRTAEELGPDPSYGAELRLLTRGG